MRIQLITKPGPGMTGTSRYATELYRGLQAAGVDVRLSYPARAPIPGPVQGGLKRLGLDAQAFFTSYPLSVRLDEVDVYHVTTQTMATLLWLQRFPGPVVVTVLDIIPYLLRHDKELNTFRHPVDYLFYRLALTGLKRAEALIAISEYTKRTLVETLGLPLEKIHVVYPAVDHQQFRPLEVPESFWEKYRLDREARYVLYVGSDDPRKNLRTLIQAFAQVQQRQGNVRLLKVGAAYAHDRQLLLSLIAQLRLKEHVLFFDSIPDEDLPLFYNVAQVFVMPSLYEGFGLPALEAMACGTAVVCSNAASLPEIVGTATLLMNPGNVVGLTEAIGALLSDQALQERQRLTGLEQSARFTWDQTAEDTAKVYSAVVTELTDRNQQ